MAINQTVSATQITIGYHPDGYRIDKTASPMNRYTQWEILPDGIWGNPKPVSFHALPQEGWLEIDGFDWGQIDTAEK